MKRNVSLEKNLLFLMAVLVASNAKTPTGAGTMLSLDKKIHFDRIMEKRYSDMSFDERQKMVVKTLRTLPTLTGGLALLKRVEKSSRAISNALEGNPKKVYGVLRQLLELSQAAGPTGDKEQLILRAIHANLGLRGIATLRHTPEGQLVLKRVKATAAAAK